MSETLVAAVLDGHPARSPALVSASGATWSHGRLATSAATVADRLSGHVEPSGVVAVVAGNGPAAVPVLLGAGTAAVCAPLPARQTVEDRVAQLDRLAPQVLLVTADAESPEDGQAAARLGIPVVRLPVDADGMLDVSAPVAFVAHRRGSAAPAGTALLIHTSGTTGAGKLVPLRASGLAHAARTVAATLGLTPADRCLTALPLHHTHGLVGAVLSSLTAGGSVICLPGYADDAMTRALTGLAPTWYTAVPAIHARVAALAEAGRLDGHRLQLARSASAPLTGQLLDRLRAALGVPVLQAYALTEAPGQICGHRPQETVHSGSVGRPYGCEVTVDAAGQVLVRGPHVCPGYLSAVDGELVPHRDGWLHTGDLGRLTDDGELYLVGRADDVVNRAGEKVPPEEIEQVLAGCPGVTDVVVFGAPDPVLGQQIVALVAGTAGAGEVSGYAARILSPGRRPDRVVPVDRIPRSATGKVNRRELSGLLPAPDGPAQDGPAQDGAAPRIDAVAEIWAHVLFLPAVDPDADFAELGGGSLQAARIEALVAERFGVELPPAVVLDHGSTVRRMARLIASARPQMTA